MELDKIIQHDVANPFPLPDECIDVIFTSPPYWGLRDYGIKSIFGGDPNCEHEWVEEGVYYSQPHHGIGSKTMKISSVTKDALNKPKPKSVFCNKCGAWYGQLGLEPHPQMFIDHLVMICREIKRVLKKSGSFYLNIGDTYCGSGCGTNDYRTEKSRSIQGIGKNKNLYKTGGISAKLKYDGCWLQPKQLLGIPERVMIALQNDGWILRNKNVWHKINSMPSSAKDRLNNTWEPVFHFVKNARKYYYDLDAIREPHKTESLERVECGFNVIPRAWEQEVIPISGGKKVNIDCHPAGKNPGDVTSERVKQNLEHFTSKGSGGHYTYGGLDAPEGKHQHPDGKNPGDVLEYDSKYKDAEYGQTAQGFTRSHSKEKERIKSREDAKKLFPNNPKKQQEYINYIHDHGGHPMGHNPGDVVKHDIAVGRIGNFSYNDPLHTKEYHPDGKNPGDIIQFDEEYWWNFILGRAHSNRFYKKAYELMKNWMIKNNCFDYAIFYEWYKKEFEGKWESGTLEKGKANYLSDEKRLPFPKPETRFLGDIPGDFWSLTTQPFTGYNPDLEHFAVFPESLVLKPLKATCPKEVCKKCGKPKRKVVVTGGTKEAFNIRVRDVKEKRIKHTNRIASKTEVENYDEQKYISKIKKYVVAAGCNCNDGFDAGVVLDPFCGRGTVGKVAKSLGLHYILFDAKPEYCELARLFIGGQKHKIPKGQSSLDVFS